jgi:hypothetical protein
MRMFCWSCREVKTFADTDEGPTCECGHVQDSEAAGAAELCELATWHDVAEYNRVAAIAKAGGFTVPESPAYL